MEYQTPAPEMVDEVQFFEALPSLGGWYQTWDEHGSMLLCLDLDQLDLDQADRILPIALEHLAEQGIVAIVTAIGRGLARRNGQGALQEVLIDLDHLTTRSIAWRFVGTAG